MFPRRSQWGEVQTWVNSQWKIPTFPGQISTEINTGSVILLLSSTLQRFQEDSAAGAEEWNLAAPLFGGHSVGQVIVAAANGVRHDDEWAKTRVAKPIQRRSQDILSKALPSASVRRRLAPGLAIEVLDTLSSGGSFEKLNENMFTFAHGVALKVRARGSRPI